MMYLKYLKAVLRHKWYVFKASVRFGVPWRGLIHDLSKFLPSEFIPYAKSFYGDYSDDERKQIKESFDVAWNHHQKRNKHHWQYWVLMNDSDGTYALPMPECYIREMVSDWIGAGQAYGNPDTMWWYEKNKDKQIMHEFTRYTTETLLWHAVNIGLIPDPREKDESV